MKRPIITALLFYIAGILAGQYLRDVSLVLFFMVLTLLCFCLYLKWRWKPAGIFILFAFSGLYCIGQSQPPGYFKPHIQAGEEAVMTGTVREVELTKTGRQKILFSIEEIYFPTGGYKSPILIQAVLPEGEAAAVGDSLRLTGSLQEPQKKRNPGGFDEELYFYANNIYYKTFPEAIEKINIPSNNYGLFIHTVRLRWAEIYDRLLPEKEASIIKSMIIGDRRGLQEDVKELYRLAGIYHILAISGLHISVLALFAKRVLTQFLGRRTSGIIVISFLSLYCLMTGSSVSTVRAVVMTGVIIAAPLLYRSSDLLASAGFACLLLLFYRPYYLWDIGFQYSFTAVFSIASAAVPMERVSFLIYKKISILQPILKHPLIKDAFGSTLAVALGTTPLVAYHFYYFMPYSFFVNLLIIPTVSFIIPLGFLTGIVGLIHHASALFLSGTLYYALVIYEKTCRLFLSLPASAILCGSWPIPVMILFYVSFGTFILLLKSYGEKYLLLKKWAYVTGVIFIAAYGIRKLWPQPPEVTMLDVGQGDSFVIRNDGSCFIIDGGGWPRWEGDNTGKKILTPFLDYYAVDFVDAVFVTHGDGDHITGIIELLEKKKVGGIYLPLVSTEPESLMNTLILEAEKYKIPVSFIKKGDIIEAGSLSFRCLHPEGQQGDRDDNNSSLVLKADLRGTEFLFTGDIDYSVEALLLQGDVRAAVLKSPHHGSKTASTSDFLEAVAPSVVIISAGEGNSYGHPSEEALERIKALGIPYYVTAEGGAVSLQVRKGALHIRKMIN